MELKIYNKFELIPESREIENSIPIFATQAYSNYLKYSKKSETLWFEFNNQMINYLIPLAISKKNKFKKGIFLTAVISLGMKESKESEKEFLNEIIKYIKKKKLCDWITQSPNWAIFNTVPDGALSVPFGTYRINLEEKTEEELFLSIRRKDRQDINKAIRENLKTKTGNECYDDSINLINSTLKLANLKSFTNKKHELINKFLKENTLNYTVYSNNIAQSSCIYFYNSFSTYAMMAGTKNRPARGATSLLYWEAIKESKKRNVKYFDFVGAIINPIKGSKPYKIQKFKTHFGPELKEGFVWKIVINKSKYNLYINYLKIKKFLKGKKYKADYIDREMKRLRKI